MSSSRVVEGGPRGVSAGVRAGGRVTRPRPSPQRGARGTAVSRARQLHTVPHPAAPSPLFRSWARPRARRRWRGGRASSTWSERGASAAAAEAAGGRRHRRASRSPSGKSSREGGEWPRVAESGREWPRVAERGESSREGDSGREWLRGSRQSSTRQRPWRWRPRDSSSYPCCGCVLRVPQECSRSRRNLVGTSHLEMLIDATRVKAGLL